MSTESENKSASITNKEPQFNIRNRSRLTKTVSREIPPLREKCAVKTKAEGNNGVASICHPMSGRVHDTWDTAEGPVQ